MYWKTTDTSFTMEVDCRVFIGAVLGILRKLKKKRIVFLIDKRIKIKDSNEITTLMCIEGFME